MLENYNRYKLLKIFLNNPTDNFRLRELGRLSKISPPSTSLYLKEFEKKKLILKYEKRNIPYYKANTESEDFTQYKKISILYEIHRSELTNFIWEKTAPDAIILYGSQAKGESTETSDLDLFIVGKEKKIELKKFEEKLGMCIHLIFEKEVKNIPKELKNNLANGIVLKGYFKVI